MGKKDVVVLHINCNILLLDQIPQPQLAQLSNASAVTLETPILHTSAVTK